MSKEIWKAYPLNENYLVSNYGNVKNKNGRMLKPYSNKGYLYISASKNNKRTTTAVHRMVLMAFHYFEGCENLQVDHVDGVKSNNHLENLRWVSSQENIQIKNQNYEIIHGLLSQIIQIHGYEKTIKILEKAIDI